MPSGLMREGFHVVRANMPRADLCVRMCARKGSRCHRKVRHFSLCAFVFRWGGGRGGQWTKTQHLKHVTHHEELSIVCLCSVLLLHGYRKKRSGWWTEKGKGVYLGLRVCVYIHTHTYTYILYVYVHVVVGCVFPIQRKPFI